MKFFISFWCYCLASAILLAQQPLPFDVPIGDFPLDAYTGKCYAQCYSPDVYEEITDPLIIREPHITYDTLAAEYDTVEQIITLREGFTVLELEPAVFESRTVQVKVSDSTEILHYFPPEMQTVMERTLVKPAGIRWVKSSGQQSCLSADCQVWCLQEVSAEYQTVQRTVIKRPARIEKTIKPATYINLRRGVVVRPARVLEKQVLPETKRIVKMVLRKPARVVEVMAPAWYSTITTKRLTKKRGWSQFVEVVCDSHRGDSRITSIAIQRALKKLGYKVSISGVVDKETRAALTTYQKNHGLPVGNLNIETLKKLGVFD